MSIAILLSGPVAADGDRLSVAGVAPLPASVLALMADGSADAGTLAMTSTSTAQASISHSAVGLAGPIRTGDVALGSLSADGGVGSLQAATGIGNIQQNSVALAVSF
jgi:hypothetical protein